MVAGRELGAAGVLIRPPEPADEAGYAALLSEPRVAAWLRPDPLPPLTETEVAAMLADDVRHWREAGFGPWALTAGDPAELIGRVGLRRTSIGGELMIELAWTVLPDWQRRGVATSAAREAVELARALAMEELVALVLPANLASRRVAEKVGMGAAGEVTHAGLPHLLYRLEL